MPEIYIQFKNKVLIDKSKRDIYVQDIAHISAPNPCIVGNIKVYTLTMEDGDIYSIAAVDVVRKISKELPNHSINIVGADHILVERKRPEKKSSIFLIILAWIVLFFGSGLTIMYFHEDVSMKEVHINLHYLLTGEKKENPYWLQIPYSIGVGIGMMVFFNHLLRKKITEEPSPLEVEMFLYQENIDKYMLKQPDPNNKDDK